MQFYKNNTNPTYSNPLTIMRENYKYEVVDLVNNKVAFTNRMPRKDSNFFNLGFLIWNLKENTVAHGVTLPEELVFAALKLRLEFLSPSRVFLSENWQQS